MEDSMPHVFNPNILHTEFFYSGRRCCFVDLKHTAADKPYIQIAVGTDEGDETLYRRLVFFEEELIYLAEALSEVLKEYAEMKAKQDLL